MTNINLQQKNYKAENKNFQLVLPLNYEVIIPEDDSVRLLSQILEGMDYKNLYKAYSSDGRNPAVEPKILFKVIVYAYMNGIYSSRKIESACRRDINFMWLLAGEAVPDHTTISRFRKERLGEVMEEMFYQFVKILHELGEVNYENVFIDGTKIEANANRYTFVWKKAVEKNEAKMQLRIGGVAEELQKLYFKEFRVSKESLHEDMKKMIDFLEQKKKEENVEFVYGSGKRKSNIQKLLESLYEYRNRQIGYDESKELFDGRNSYSKTDTDATFMRMKDDHMKNGQLRAGYNVQLGVESEYVVGVGIFPDRTDVTTLKPFLENIYDFTARRIQRVIADAGYESEENYIYLEEKGQDYYIKPQTYEQGKKQSFKKDIGRRENMLYNSETDEYTCHNGKQLKVVGQTKKTSATGYVSDVTVYECENCEGCPCKEKCTKAKGNRQLRVSKVFVEKRQKSLENITTTVGAQLRVNRSIESEGAFGVIKQDRQFTRFLTRGKQNVKIETLLLCLGFNVNKLHAKIQSERCGKPLHELKSA
jgi:transposase